MRIPATGASLLVGLVALLPAVAAVAQIPAGATPRQTWKMEGARAVWCVQFLMEAGPAEKQLSDRYAPLAASSVDALHPAIRRLLTDEPQYQGWVPAALCAWFFDAVTVDSRRISDKDLKDAQGVLWWGIAAKSEASPGVSASDWATALLATNNWHIQKPAESLNLAVGQAEMSLTKLPERSDDRYQIKVGKTTILFDGHSALDSTLIANPVEQVWAAEGPLRSHWTVRYSSQPDSARALVGALRVEGKDELAKALRASPIRMVGPLYGGGTAQMLFFR